MSPLALGSVPTPVTRDRSATLDSQRELERRLLERYHYDGDVAAREELVARLMPFARELALRYAYTGEPVDDLIQVASLGLLKAIDRFEPGRGTKLTSYAAPTILGEIKRHFRDNGWALHVPRGLRERALAVNRECERLSKELGRSPSVREVAGALECSSEEVLEASEAAGSYQAASLDAPVASDGEDSAAFADLLGSHDDGYELAESRHAIAATWRTLPQVERKVLKLRLLHDLTQREIGQRIGYSQMHVSRLLRRALDRLEQAAVAA